MKDALNLLDASLESHNFVAGKELTLADISLLASLSLAESVDYDFNEWKNVNKWLDRLKNQLPYYDDINTSAINSCREYFNFMNKQNVP